MAAFDSPQRGITLNSNQIKGLAAVLMVIDHIGAVFFPQTVLLRWIGRLSFPLFSWLLAQGEQRTRNVYRYGLRLLLFGIVSQPVYIALFGTRQLNVLFTLLVGLVTLRLGRVVPQIQYLIWASGILVAALIPMDGSGYGVAIMLLMAYPITLRWWAAWLLLHGALAASGGISLLQLWAIPAPLIVMLASDAPRKRVPQKYLPRKPMPQKPVPPERNRQEANGEPAPGDIGDNPPPKPASPRRGFRVRWFYWFYPGHLLALWLVRLLI